MVHVVCAAGIWLNRITADAGWSRRAPPEALARAGTRTPLDSIA